MIGALAVASLVVSGAVRADLGDGLIAFWDFEEGSGVNVGDASGNGHDGTGQGGFQFSPNTPFAESAYSGQFNDVGYVTVPDAVQLDPTGDFTLAAWINTYDGSGYNIILGKHGSGVGNDGSWMWGATNGAAGETLVHYFIATPWQTELYGSVSGALSEWRHFAMAYVDATDQYTHYIDGVPVESGTYVADIADNAQTLIVGGSEGGSHKFNGLLDDVYMYGRALSEAEIQQLAHSITECGWDWDSSTDPNFLLEGETDNAYYVPGEGFFVGYPGNGVSEVVAASRTVGVCSDDVEVEARFSLDQEGYDINICLADETFDYLDPYAAGSQWIRTRFHIGHEVTLNAGSQDATGFSETDVIYGEPQGGNEYKVVFGRSGTDLYARFSKMIGDSWTVVGEREWTTHAPDAALNRLYLVGTGDHLFGDGLARFTRIVVRSTSPATGDLNCDGWLNNGDIDAFILAIENTALYYVTYPDCDHMLGDCNGDRWVNNGDIDPFVALLAGK